MSLKGCQSHSDSVALDPELACCSRWDLGLAIQTCPPPDSGNIASGSYKNHHLVGFAFRFVVLLQLSSKSPRLRPYDRVLTRIEVSLSPIDLGSDGVFFEIFFKTAQHLLDNKP